MIDEEERISKLKKLNNPTSQELRELMLNGSREMKTTWVRGAQVLYTIWRDKLYEYWGFERFEHYAEREVGIRKPAAMKMVKCYAFLEHNEAQFLKADALSKDPCAIPELDAINVLRSARFRKELSKQDYADLRRLVFDKGRPASEVRTAMKNMIAERKKPDPEEEKEERRCKAARTFINSVRLFQREASALKMVSQELLKKAMDVFKEIEAEL